jgi:hypothetical protein
MVCKLLILKLFYRRSDGRHRTTKVASERGQKPVFPGINRLQRLRGLIFRVRCLFRF